MTNSYIAHLSEVANSIHCKALRSNWLLLSERLIKCFLNIYDTLSVRAFSACSRDDLKIGFVASVKMLFVF